MKYSITITEKDNLALMKALEGDVEKAAYLHCRIAKSEEDINILVRTVSPVLQKDIIRQSAVEIAITSSSFMRALKHCDEKRECIAFIHSHPNGFVEFSEKDINEERKFFKTAFNRLGYGPHVALLFSDGEIVAGRVWEDGVQEPISVERVKIIGENLAIRYFDERDDSSFECFDRQIRAFGKQGQKVLAKLTIGIVGLGGTGSAVAEQLIRLGVGKLVIMDDDTFEVSNISRVYGSKIEDKGKPKVDIIEDLADRIGLGTVIQKINQKVVFEAAAKELKTVDIIFLCTDDNWGRSVVNRLSFGYYIPVFDVGIKIGSSEGKIEYARGRVSVLKPGSGCLFCRQRITSQAIMSESQKLINPENYDRLVAEGYTPEITDTEPSIIPFTTIVSSHAIIEMFQLLFSFKGNEEINEIIFSFDINGIIRLRKRPNNGCRICGEEYLGLGDSEPFLGMSWPNET